MTVFFTPLPYSPKEVIFLEKEKFTIQNHHHHITDRPDLHMDCDEVI